MGAQPLRPAFGTKGVNYLKTLILSANAGQGHNACAGAICEAFEAHGVPCVIEDTFGLIARWLSVAIAKNHEKTYREKPQKSHADYQFMIGHPELFAKKKIIYQVMSLGGGRIARCVREGGYDTVICTHALSAMILTSAIQKERLNLKTAFVATDYTCSPGVNGTELDRYFIPHAMLKPMFIDAEVPESKLRVTGIPVRRAFCKPYEKRQRKEMFGIAPEKRHLLMMCGSMGCGPIPEMLGDIAAALPQNWEITVACGTNEALRRQLDDAHGAHPAIRILGYTRDMPELLTSADLYLTKPGGLSTAEAAAAGVPMVLIDAVGGCEENNLLYFTRTGAAVTGDSPKDVALSCVSLMRDEARLQAMTEELQKHSAVNAAERLYQEMEALFL